jgi:hypothetical protein|tara:strand:- start:103 stop:363 length:261 start_codon:yes stop_codon:yes gene_type:complete
MRCIFLLAPYDVASTNRSSKTYSDIMKNLLILLILSLNLLPAGAQNEAPVKVNFSVFYWDTYQRKQDMKELKELHFSYGKKTCLFR